MTGYFFKAVAAAVITVILVGILKRDNGSISMVLSLAAAILLLFFAAMILQPVLHYFQELADTADFQDAYLLPILKCTGIGIMTQIAVSVCKDAGESSLASMIELCGCTLALFLALPLFNAVLQMIRELMGA